MIGTDSNHCRIVAESLAGARGVDEETLASLAILDDRLERLKKLDEAFSGVAFSRAVEQLRNRGSTIAAV
ncbi:MAG: hypothetical protein H8E73_04755 [Planctomycetes bacterium]|jgi:hypothetical protein|nr:hypothetical protein [Planctomycetota bacterium]MBL7185200.1 hypothetical protein [Phycisphaerae bacterium]